MRAQVDFKIVQRGETPYWSVSILGEQILFMLPHMFKQVELAMVTLDLANNVTHIETHFFDADGPWIRIVYNLPMNWASAHMKELRESASESALWLGHEMGPWEFLTDHSSEALCKECGKGVCVDTRPPLNGIDVGGEAVALGCED